MVVVFSVTLQRRVDLVTDYGYPVDMKSAQKYWRDPI